VIALARRAVLPWLAVAACSPPTPRAPAVDLTALLADSAAGHQLSAPGAPRATVLVFFSPRCDCLAAHEPRLNQLYGRYRARGVVFAVVDSESRGSVEGDAAEAARRGYPFPILRDRQGHLAAALGARFASESVLLDAAGRLRYRGGIDSDGTHLHASAEPYLQDAIDDLLAGRAPRRAEAPVLGCLLQTW